MICPSCFKTMSSLEHDDCSKSVEPPFRHFRHYVGVDDPIAAIEYKAASWGDLELLVPVLWPDWIAGKIASSAYDPSQVTDLQQKRRMLAAVAKQLNTVIETCTKVPQADRTGWTQFTQAFIPWFNKGPDDSLFGGLKADTEQADAFQDQLRAWEEEISKYCNIGMPLLPRSAPTLSQLGHETLETAGKYFDTLKTVAIVGLVGLALVFFMVGRGNVQRAFVKVLPR